MNDLLKKIRRERDISNLLYELGKDGADRIVNVDYDEIYKLLNEAYNIGFEDGHNAAKGVKTGDFGEWLDE